MLYIQLYIYVFLEETLKEGHPKRADRRDPRAAIPLGQVVLDSLSQVTYI